jgi:TonB family protein
MFLNQMMTLSPRAWAAVGCLAVSLPVSMPVLAQPAPAASAAASDLNPVDRARRDADRVFQMILMHSDKPRKAGATKEDAPTATARAKPVARAPAKGDEPVPKAEVSSGLSAPIVARAAAEPQKASATNEVATPVPQTVVTAAPAEAPVAVAAATPAMSAPEELADESLTPLLRPEPEFPQNLMRTVHKGEVRVRFTVLPDGSVDAPAVVTTSHPRLNAAALAAIAQWRFVPLRKAQTAIVSLGFDID